MASTYSQYKIELIGTGEQPGIWGNTTNNNFGSSTPGEYRGFEQAIGGKADVNMDSTTKTLSLTNSSGPQDARALYLNLTGTPGGAAVLEVPAIQKGYLVKNGSNQVVTVKVTGQTGVAVPVGATMWLYNNGTDVTNAITNLPSGATVGGVAIGTGNGSVTSVSGTGTINGISLSGTVTSSGNITLGGALTGVDLATQVTGILPGGNGGTNNAFFQVSGPATSIKTYTFPNEAMSVGYRNIPAIADKTAAYTLATGDVGKVVGVGSGGSIEIPDATFAAGDAVLVFNNTTGPITITCTITTAYIAGADADVASVTLATRGVCNILFISGTVCVLTGNIA